VSLPKRVIDGKDHQYMEKSREEDSLDEDKAGNVVAIVKIVHCTQLLQTEIEVTRKEVVKKL
jgi:hypothetical protein